MFFRRGKAEACWFQAKVITPKQKLFLSIIPNSALIQYSGFKISSNFGNHRSFLTQFSQFETLSSASITSSSTLSSSTAGFCCLDRWRLHWQVLCLRAIKS